MKGLFKILKFCKKFWRYYLAIGILSILMAAMAQVTPLILGRLVDGFSSGNLAKSAALILVLFLFLADFSQTLLNNINGHFGDILSLKISNFLSDKFYAKMLRLPQGYFDDELTGTIVSKLNRSTGELSRFMQAFSNNFLGFIFSSTFSIVIIFSMSKLIGLILLVLYPVYILLTIRSSGKWQKLEAEKNELKDSAAGRFQEAISNMKTIKSFSAEQKELSFFNSTLSKMLPINKKQSAYWNKQDFSRRAFVNTLFGAIYFVIVLQLYSGAITVGQAVSLAQFAMIVRIPIFTISFLVSQIQQATASSKDYFALLNEVEEDQTGTKKLKDVKGEIKFNKVSFSYGKGEKVFSDISFSVKPGQKVALVGESGQGKSTLAHLLLKFYAPTSGSISIDGLNLSQVDTKSLRSHIGLVLQEPSLFSGTIEENIEYGKPGSSKKEVVSAAKAANADSFILKLKESYDSFIGERGIKLSGGQKQRVAIARTILKDAPILILDEATSSLDSKAEKEVQVALENLTKNKTTIIIAHRLSTISGADLIVTLKNGKVDEVGSPAELAKTKGVYAELLKLQTEGTKTSKKQLEKFEVS